jgi:hypothetical protein
MKQVEASGRHTTDASKPVPSVTTLIAKTPPKDSIFCAGKSQDVTEHDTRKPTPIIATPIVETLPQDGIFGADERRDAKEHNMENQRQASRRRKKTQYLGQMSIRKPTPCVATSGEDAIFIAAQPQMPMETTLENRRRVSPKGHHI